MQNSSETSVTETASATAVACPDRIRTWLTVLAILTVSAYWYGLFSPVPERWTAVPSFDSVFFVKFAEQIRNHHEFGWLGYFEPCFYPILSALLAFGGDVFFSAFVISKVSVFLLPAVVYLLGRSLSGELTGVAAGLLILFFPHMTSISTICQSEALNMLLLTSSLYLLWLAWKRSSYPLAGAAGLVFVMTYLTRSEGLFLFLFTISFLALCSWWGKMPRQRMKVLALAAVIFIVGAAPHVTYLSRHYGALTLGTKTSSIYFWVREKCFQDPDPVRTEWGLSPTGELNVISMTSHDLMSYWRRDIGRSIKVYLKNFSAQLPGRIPNDGGMAHYPQVFPLYLALPLLAGPVLRYRRRESLLPVGYLAAPFLLLLIYPLLTGGWWRYLINLLPFFLILTAMALDELAQAIGAGRRAVLLTVAVVAVCAYHTWIVRWQPVPQKVNTYTQQKGSAAEETRKAGAWARSIIPPDAIYMAQWTRLPFYLEGRWIPMPETDLLSLLQFARRKSVQYLLVESGDPTTAAQLASSMVIPGATYVGTHSNPSLTYFCTILRLM